jgi:hypothetical protein
MLKKLELSSAWITPLAGHDLPYNTTAPPFVE